MKMGAWRTNKVGVPMERSKPCACVTRDVEEAISVRQTSTEGR